MRKMASSLAFFTDMSYQAISHMTGWSSTSVFVKHYLSSIDKVRQGCIALGRVVDPRSRDDLGHSDSE